MCVHWLPFYLLGCPDEPSKAVGALTVTLAATDPISLALRGASLGITWIGC
ncbi:hypothetical protein [Candidatus Poriferisodalis sp.]|uniref:hypothetical protein n=1 Tax=Candidatus Poriferisodalis sp. TaxID=3101277 RepID=UPI003AF88006